MKSQVNSWAISFSSRHFAFSFVEVEGYAYVRGAGWHRRCRRIREDEVTLNKEWYYLVHKNRSHIPILITTIDLDNIIK